MDVKDLFTERLAAEVSRRKPTVDEGQITEGDEYYHGHGVEIRAGLREVDQIMMQRVSLEHTWFYNGTESDVELN